MVREGINSSYKFIQKLMVLNINIIEEITKDHPDNQDMILKRLQINLLKKITNNLENFNYNIIIANFMKLYSYLRKKLINISKKTLKENYEKILTSIMPIIPHFV